VLHGNELSSALSDTEDSQHGVDCRHLGEDTGISDTHALQAADLQLGVDNSVLILLHVTHLGGAGRVVHSVSNAAAVFGKVLVALDLEARGNFALDPVLEWCLLSNLTSSLKTSDDSSSIVALRIGEIAEVQSGLDVGVRRSEVDAATGAGAGNVGCHAEGVDGRVVAKSVSSQLCSIQDN
jgi:hypothetical protein